MIDFCKKTKQWNLHLKKLCFRLWVKYFVSHPHRRREEVGDGKAKELWTRSSENVSVEISNHACMKKESYYRLPATRGSNRWRKWSPSTANVQFAILAHFCKPHLGVIRHQSEVQRKSSFIHQWLKHASERVVRYFKRDGVTVHFAKLVEHNAEWERFAEQFLNWLVDCVDCWIWWPKGTIRDLRCISMRWSMCIIVRPVKSIAQVSSTTPIWSTIA